MTAMKDLKEATWSVHARMQKNLGVKHLFSEFDLYREHIARLEAFHSVAEAEWGPLLEETLADFPARRKGALLESDLEAVCGARVSGAAVPTPADTASALGAFYVLEGPTLGGRHLLPIVEAKLGLTAKHGASYFASYGSDVDAMWKRFGATVEAHCATPETRGAAVEAAQSTFLAMEAWLCGERCTR